MTTAVTYATPGNFARFGVLAVSNVSFAYGDYRAVENVSFQLVPGERVALVGPNGCGKSTVLRLILGSLTPAGGTVTIDGQSPRALGRIGMARRMALVPQLAGPNAADLGSAGYTVRQIVLMARFAHHARGEGLLGSFVALGFENEADLRAADIAMWNADVHHLAGRTLDTLSGGERQRVAIVRAMAQETPIVLLDEPTSALDLYHQLELLAQLESMTGADGAKGIVMVTHDLQLAQRFATRVLLMDRGKLVVNGPPGEVLTAKYLEEVYRVKVLAAGGERPALWFNRLESGPGP